jgi:hypothetical protein
MTKKQMQQLDQFQSTDYVLEAGDHIWNLPGYGKFIINVAEFRNSLSEVNRYKLIQIPDEHGAKLHAEQARLDMAFKSIKVRAAIQNFASDEKNKLLFQQVRFPESKLKRGGIQKSLSYARIIEAKAREIIDDLLPYNLTVEELDLYKLSIKKFEDARGAAAELKINRKNATAQLSKLCPDTRKIIEEKLRNGATQFMITAPDFYSLLISSFEINRYPTHYTEFEILTKDKTSGNALGGVKITATSVKGVMEQFSNPVGEADLKQFEPSWWTLTYECPGYRVLTMPNLKVELGKKIALVAELEKEE